MKAKLLCVAILATASPAIADDWHLYSRSQSNVFMADVASIVAADGVTSIRMTIVPKAGEAGDYSHSIETYQFQCDQGRWRTAGVIEHGPDGAQLDAYPEEGAEWMPLRSGTMPEQLKEIACEGARANPPTWPTVQAWIDAGRP